MNNYPTKNNLYEPVRIALGLCFYNKRDEINRLLNTIEWGSISVILGIDGIFSFLKDRHKNDPDFCALSTDGSRELLQEFEACTSGITKVIIDNCVGNEFEKRNRYLELCEIMRCNYLLIVDTDEYFDTENTDWDLFKQDWVNKVKRQGGHNVWSIKTIVDVYGREVHYPRAWFAPSEMRYHNYSHFKYKNYAKGEQYNDILDSQYSAGTINHLVLKHDHLLRKQNDMEDRNVYENYLVRYEELVARKIDPRSADIIARYQPSKHKDNCICFTCIDFNKIDVEKIVDPRKIEDRINDPFEKFRNKSDVK